jgi:hypothetical protein
MQIAHFTTFGKKKLGVGFLLFSNMFSQAFTCSSKFPMGFQYVPKVFNVFPQYVLLKSTSICPISFALSSTLVT